MKTIKIKKGYTRTEGLEWLLRCSKHQDEGGGIYNVLANRPFKVKCLFDDDPHEYEIIPKPEQQDAEFWDKWGGEALRSYFNFEGTPTCNNTLTVSELAEAIESRIMAKIEGGQE